MQSDRGKYLVKFFIAKRLRGIKNRAKYPQKTTTMIIFYSERAKRVRKSFGKVLQSKRLRGIKKNRAKRL